MIKYSIVIPTADRHYLLQHALRSCLATVREDIEVIVSDNFSGPETRAVVDAHRQDGRLKYFRTDRRMPMPEHWDFAWAKARGRYVIVNCDDDFLSPSGLDVIDRAIEALAPQIVSWNLALYFHPDYDSEGAPNTLRLPIGHSNLFVILNSPGVVAEYANLNFNYFPEGTHFCIAKELGDKVINTTGRLFWAPAPDFSAPLLALVAADRGRYCYIDSVLGFGGRSRHSNAGGFAPAGNSAKSTRLQEFLSEFRNEDELFPHHPLRIPFYYNAHLSAISLLKKFYPDSANLHVDSFKFFCSAYEELFGIKHNPMVDRSMEGDLQKYIEGLEPAQRVAAASARREVSQRRHFRMPRNRSEFIRTITPRFLKEWLKRFSASMGGEIRRSTLAIPGEKHGFSNGFELGANWDRLVRENDRFTLAGLSDAFSKNLVLSTHAARDS